MYTRVEEKILLKRWLDLRCRQLTVDPVLGGLRRGRQNTDRHTSLFLSGPFHRTIAHILALGRVRSVYCWGTASPSRSSSPYSLRQTVTPPITDISWERARSVSELKLFFSSCMRHLWECLPSQKPTLSSGVASCQISMGSPRRPYLDGESKLLAHWPRAVT